jgi:hypothetical protein
MQRGDPIKRVQDLVDAIANTRLGEKHHAHVRLWFRGQSNSEWSLSPAVYRATFPEQTEERRLWVERHLTQDFRIEGAGLLAGSMEDTDVYFLQQHYRMPTRLLDWTTNPLAALHFAVCENPTLDGNLFLLDAYSFAPTQEVTAQFEGVATSRSEIFRRALRVIFDWYDPPEKFFSTFLLPIRPGYSDRRVYLQRSCFTFHVPSRPHVTKSENSTLHCFVIPSGSKSDIRDELFRLGVDAFAIYGDLESLATRLKFAYKVH